MQALGEIKKEYRIALVLREIEELSYEEIAETLAISIGTVKSRIARGREELRRRVRDLIERRVTRDRLNQRSRIPRVVWCAYELQEV